MQAASVDRADVLTFIEASDRVNLDAAFALQARLQWRHVHKIYQVRRRFPRRGSA